VQTCLDQNFTQKGKGLLVNTSVDSYQFAPNLIPNGPNAKRFKMALLNIVSLPKHVDELRISKLFMCFDLFALNETRLDSSISVVW
jgi:hypothetical protein